MLPDEIVQKSSLMENEFGNIKFHITIWCEIDKKNIFTQKIMFKFSIVKYELNQIKTSHMKSANNIYVLKTLFYGIRISKALQKERHSKTIGVKLNELNNSIVCFDENVPYLYISSDNEIEMKHMIAEFAIFANSFIGSYFKIHFDDKGIYRTCEASNFTRLKDKDSLSGSQLIHEIVLNGIQAEYQSKRSSHDLVGAEEYTHFTSPIRRASDCICHYILKYIHIQNIKTNSNTIKNLQIPFTLDELRSLYEKCLIVTKQMKNYNIKTLSSVNTNYTQFYTK